MVASLVKLEPGQTFNRHKISGCAGARSARALLSSLAPESSAADVNTRVAHSAQVLLHASCRKLEKEEQSACFRKKHFNKINTHSQRDINIFMRQQ